MQTKTSYRLVGMFVLISLVISACLVAYTSSSAAPLQVTTLSFTATADAYVIASSPDANYGTATTVRVDNTPVTRSYLRFSVSGLNGATIQSAKLRIYANSANGAGYIVSVVADNNWTESTVTYNSAPAMGTKISSSQPFSSGTWVEADVTSYVKTTGVFNMVLTTSSATNTSLASRESGANAPELIITTGTTSTSSPTATPVPTQVSSGSSNILLLAGDICRHDLGGTDYTSNCKKTGDLVRSILTANPGTQVQTLGDNVNNEPIPYSYEMPRTPIFMRQTGVVS